MATLPAADHNLLFGVLALQNHLIDRDTLIGALESWAREPGRSLGELLVERGDLSPPERATLEELLSAQTAREAREAAASATDSVAAKTAPLASIAANSLTINLFADDDLAGSLQAAGVSPKLLERPPAAPPVPPRSGTQAATVLDRKQGDGAPTSDAAAGRFRPLRLHARGGLGEVYVAVDEELHREVALKEIQGKYSDDSDARGRFLREAEITGGLEHPGIVPVYGLGAYPDGRPYYAMRFIRGETLRDAIAEHHRPAPDAEHDPGERDLALRKLLGRFLAAVNAIDYAHSRGVIHRDIKPENILIGPFGETLVVDWGLARAQGRDEAHRADGETTLHVASGDSTSTRQGAVLGTPAYMSPEQALGWNDLITPASDIYSLGATLYSLLTGKLPVTGATDIASLLQRVQTGDFPKPRTITSEVPEPLEAICLKAMSTKASQRYASARLLADDIEAWLADQPVAAYDEPWLAKAGRWVRRHRTLVSGIATATGVTLVALVIGVVMLSLYNEELRGANQRTQVALERSQDNFKLARSAVERYMVRVSNNPLLKSQGLESLRRDLLRDASEFFDQLLHREEAGADVVSESASAIFSLAEISQEVESAEVALGYIERGLALTKKWQEAKPTHFAPPAVEVVFLAKQASILTELGQHQKAVEVYRLAAEKGNKLAPSKKALTRFSRRLIAAELQRQIGASLYWADRREEALVALTAAGEQLDQLLAEAGALKEDSAETELSAEEREVEALFASAAATSSDRPRAEGLRIEAIRAQVARKSLQAEVLSELGRSREALTLMTEAHRELEPLVAGEPDWSPVPAEWIVLLANHGKLALEAGDHATAKADFEAASRTLDPILARHPDVSEYQLHHATLLNNQSALSFAAGDTPKALAELRQSIAVMRKLRAFRPELYDYQAKLASSLGNLARMERVAGDVDRIEPAVREAIQLQQTLVKGARDAVEHQVALAGNLLFLAEWFAEQGRLADAHQELQAAKQIGDRLGSDFPDLPSAVDLRIVLQSQLARMLAEVGQAQPAKEALAVATELVERESKHRQPTDAQHPVNPALLKLRAAVAMQGGAVADAGRDPAAAEKHFREAIDVRSQLAKRTGAPLIAGAELAKARHALAATLTSKSEYDAAREEFRRAIEELKSLLAQSSGNASIRNQLAEALRARGMAAWVDFDTEEGIADIQEAIRLWSDLAKEHPQDVRYSLSSGTAWVSLGEIERMRKDTNLAFKHYSQGISLLEPHRELLARSPSSRASFRNAAFRRAEILVAQMRFREALPDLAAALPFAGGMQIEILGLQGYTQRMAGEHEGSLKTVGVLIPLSKENTTALSSISLFCAKTANDLAGDDSLEEAARTDLCERYAKGSIQALEALAASGYFQNAANRETLDKEPRMGVLRDRPDYQAFRKKIEM